MEIVKYTAQYEETIAELCKENEELENSFEQALDLSRKRYNKIKVLQQRTDKAIEYIDNWLNDKNNDDSILAMEKALNILKGD